MGKLNGLDLFSGIGGITLALQEWVVPTAYCEIDPYCRGVLLSRMSEGKLPVAPIWDDVSTLKGTDIPVKPEIIYGGFPCQDISTAGCKSGLAGERSGLFYEIARLVDEIRPEFVFLENVAAIVSRGIDAVLGEFSKLRYNCRWGIVSARSLGAPHKRERWFLLAHSNSERCYDWSDNRETRQVFADEEKNPEEIHEGGFEYVCELGQMGEILPGMGRALMARRKGTVSENNQWGTEPRICRVVDGLPDRVDRVKALGNAVVPWQARVAFERLLFNL